MLTLPVSRLRDPPRLAALEETGLRDHPPRELLDRLTRLGTRILRVPAAAITMAEADGPVFLSHQGLPEAWLARQDSSTEYSFYAHVVASSEPLIVDDARREPLVQRSPAIRELGIVSYAGLPWRTADGQVQGTYCVMDHVPRPWTRDEIGLLEQLADMVTDAVALNTELHRAAAPASTGRPPPLAPFLAQSVAGVFVLHDGRITYVNPRLAGIFGYTEAELLEMGDIAQLVDLLDRDRFHEALDRRLDGDPGTPLQSFRGRHRSGRLLWLEAEAMRIMIGSRPAIAGVVLDVTERMEAEEALRANEQRLRQVIRATSDVIREWEIRTGALTWSEGAERVLRYLPDELGAHVEWWYDRLHPDDRERVLRKIRSLIGGSGDLWEDEYRLARGDGTYATVLDRGYVVRTERGSALRLVSAMMDITDRRRGEEAQRLLAEAGVWLDESLDPDGTLAQLARHLVPALADFCAIDVVERDGTVRRVAVDHVDPAGVRILAVGGDADGTPHPLVDQVIGTRRPILIPAYGEGSGRGRAEEAGAELRELRPSSVMAAPILFGERVLGVITLGSTTPSRRYDPLDLSIAEDLGRRAGLSLQNARLYQEAQRAIGAREDMLNMVSHDLRNPLSTIRMSTDLLLDSDERREDTRKWLSAIRRSTERMEGLIEDLLDLGRIDSGGFITDAADHDATALLAEVTEALEPLAVQQEIRLTCAAEDDLPPLRADRRQLLRVFSNLVGNALKFTPAQGRVEVRARRHDRDVLFSVRDTGPGIPPDQLAHVFDRYWQAREGDRRGVGLGLAISRTIVEAHGGRIWAESTPGKGATFYFTIPACSRPAPERDGRRIEYDGATATADARGMR